MITSCGKINIVETTITNNGLCAPHPLIDLDHQRIAGAGKTLGHPASLADKTMGRSACRERLWVPLCIPFPLAQK